MKHKLTLAVVLLLIILLAGVTARAESENTFSWTHSANVCTVSDVYYYMPDGQKAFVAGGITSIPQGAEVYLTLYPQSSGDQLYRLDMDGRVDFGNGEFSELAYDEALSPDGNGGVYHFTMQDCRARALLDVSGTRVFPITFAGNAEWTESGWQSVGGKVTAYNDVDMPITSAAAGEIVSLASIPSEEYSLYDGCLSVQSQDGVPIKLYADADGLLTFAMPNSGAQISASYKPAARIEICSELCGVVTGKYAYAQPARALAGSRVRIELYPCDDAHRIDSAWLDIRDISGQTVDYSMKTADAETGAVACELDMPEGGLAINGQTKALHTVAADSSIDVYNGDDSAPIARYCAGDVLTVRVTAPSANMGLINDCLDVTAQDSSVYVMQRNVSAGGSLQEHTFEILAPDCDISIGARFGVLHSISALQAQGLGVIQTYPAGSAAAGSKVTVALLPAEGWCAVPNSIRVYTAGTRNEIELLDSNSFIMPENNCEIVAQFEPKMFNADVFGSECFDLSMYYSLSTSGMAYLPIDEGIPAGALVSVSASSKPGCKLSGIYFAECDDGGMYSQPMLISGDGSGNFIMPDSDIAVYAMCADESHIPPIEIAETPKSTDGKNSDMVSDNQNATVSTDIQKNGAKTLPLDAKVTSIDKNLRLRADCNTDCDVVSSYPNGTRVKIIGLDESGEWAQVNVYDDDAQGWMKLEYLKILSSAEKSANTFIITPVNAQTPELTINVIINDPNAGKPAYIQQRYANENVKRVFKHIICI